MKDFVQELKVWPTLSPGDHKQFHLCASGGLQAIQDSTWAIVLQGEMTTAQNTARDHCLGHSLRPQPRARMLKLFLSFFLIQWTFPWIPNPLPTLYSPYKKGHFKMDYKMVC